MSSTWGENFKISIFGESHSAGIGVIIDGLPASHEIDLDKVNAHMKRRAPGQDKTATPRKEADIPKIYSGFLNGKTEGSPLCAVIENTNTKSGDYANILNCPRPGHSDYSAFVKYNASNDIRGGGHFSGRLTAPLVFAGSIARQILEKKGISIVAHAQKIAGVEDEKFDTLNIDKSLIERLNNEYFSVISSESKEKMYEKVEEARMNLNSVGGVIECAVTGLPAGLGNPMFDGIENKLASIIFGIPAVKALEFGAGFDCCDMTGFDNNDEFYYDENGNVRTYTNNSGGILGGITNSMPLILRVGIKPTASIAIPQRSINLITGENQTLEVHGRHDPCIVPRAIPVVESAVAIALLDIILGENNV